MGDGAQWQGSFLAWWEGLWEFLPSVGAAVAVLLVGWVGARLARAGTVRLGRTFERGMVGLGGRRAPATGGDPGALGQGVYWVVLLAALTAATQILALESFVAWLQRLLLFLPTLLTAGLILAAGFFISVVVHRLTAATLSARVSQAALLGRGLQAVILVTAVILGAEQVGLDITFLVTLGAILAGGLVGALALAVSLGSGPFVRNLIGAHHLRQRVRPGEHVRIGDFQGRVTEVNSVFLVLEGPQGQVHIPGAMAQEAPLVLDPQGDEDG